MPKITPCLWFDKEAEAAANLYVSIFPNSRITSVTRYGDAGPGPKEAVSFQVDCKTQPDVDRYWSAAANA